MTLRRRNEALQEESEKEKGKQLKSIDSDLRCNDDHVEQDDAGEKSRHDAADGGFRSSAERNKKPRRPGGQKEARHQQVNDKKKIFVRILEEQVIQARKREAITAGQDERRQEQQDERPKSGFTGSAFASREIREAGHVKARRKGKGKY